MPEIPREWRAATSGEEEIDWVYYHLVASGTTASATLNFFNSDRATSGLAVTNFDVANQLPSKNRFLIKKLELLVDVNAAAGDSADCMDAAAIELYVNNKLMWSAPAPIHSVAVSLSTNRTAELGGAVNMMEFEFDKYLILNGGDSIRVAMLIGKTAVSAGTDLTIMLRGRLVRPAA